MNIQEAIRNRAVREFLDYHRERSPIFLSSIIELRAAELNCPVAEIDPEFESQIEMNWLYNKFRGSIV